jgi:hypothetical protein
MRSRGMRGGERWMKLIHDCLRLRSESSSDRIDSMLLIRAQ